MAEKIIRDPVHDVIAFQLDRPIDALLFRLLNAVEFQRLRRVRQLGFAGLAYPGADHSRYGHSLGVMETARKILDHLERSRPIDAWDRTVCLTASLLHDLGHGPFSHVFERVSGFEHEEMSYRIIEDPESEVNRTLAAHDSALPSAVTGLLRGQSTKPFLCDILSSQLDADRLDYLLRDNLMTGSRYGDYDLTWLIHALTIDDASGKLAVTWKGVSALEAYMQSRYHMYRNVYFHKVVRSAEGMVQLALQRAKRLAVQERLPWPVRDDVVYKSLLGQKLSNIEFTDLDDVSLLHCFKQWVNCDDVSLAMLCRGLLYRRVFKTVDLTSLRGEISVKEVVASAERAVEKAGGDPDYDLFFDEPNEPAPAGGSSRCGRTEDIPVRGPDGSITPFATLSPLTRALDQQLMFRRLHVSNAYIAVVREVVDEQLR